MLQYECIIVDTNKQEENCMEIIKIVDSIDNGLTYNARFLPEKYNTDQYNKFFSFREKHYSLVNRLIFLNDKLKRIWDVWRLCCEEPRIDNSSVQKLYNSALNHQEWQKNIIDIYYMKEELIAGVRKAVDECLLLYCIATQKFKKNGNPIGSIGEYLNQKNRFQDLNGFTDFFTLLNTISNAYKHSIISAQFVFIKKEPCFYVCATKESENNAYNYMLQQKYISFDELIKEFNSFYKKFDKILKTS